MSQSASNDRLEIEMLVAYADGALDADAAAGVARALARDDEACRFLDLLTASARLARTAYDEALAASAFDAKLTHLIMGTVEVVDSAFASTVVALSKRPARPHAAGRWALPLAAALALVVGGLTGFEFGRRGVAANPPPAIQVAVGAVGVGTPIATLLETKASGDPLSVAGLGGHGGRDLLVVATFRDRVGRVCREFELVGTEVSSATEAVACRDQSGQWGIEAAANLATVSPAHGRDFVPAGNEDTEAIEALLGAIGAGTPLSNDAEDALRRGGWK